MLNATTRCWVPRTTAWLRALKKGCIMTKAEKKEIRSVLLGRTVLAENGMITTLEPGFHLSAGIADGAAAVMLWGIKKKSWRFETKFSRQKTLKEASSAMQNIGRGLILREQPEVSACLIRYLLTRPVVLIFSYVEDVPVLSAWTGRGLSGWLSQKRALKAFEDELSDGIRLSLDKAPEDKLKKENKNTEAEKEEESEAESETDKEEREEDPEVSLK